MSRNKKFLSNNGEPPAPPPPAPPPPAPPPPSQPELTVETFRTDFFNWVTNSKNIPVNQNLFSTAIYWDASQTISPATAGYLLSNPSISIQFTSTPLKTSLIAWQKVPNQVDTKKGATIMPVEQMVYPQFNNVVFAKADSTGIEPDITTIDFEKLWLRWGTPNIWSPVSYNLKDLPLLPTNVDSIILSKFLVENPIYITSCCWNIQNIPNKQSDGCKGCMQDMCNRNSLTVTEGPPRRPSSTCENLMSAYCTGDNLNQDICGCYQDIYPAAKNVIAAYKNVIDIPPVCLNGSCLSAAAFKRPSKDLVSDCPRICAAMINPTTDNYGVLNLENPNITQYCGDRAISITNPPDSTYYTCSGEECIIDTSGGTNYPNDPNCGGNCVKQTWNCTKGECVDPKDGNGTYQNLLDCKQDCPGKTYNCIKGTCTEAPSGKVGKWYSLQDCKDMGGDKGGPCKPAPPPAPPTVENYINVSKENTTNFYVWTIPLVFILLLVLITFILFRIRRHKK